MDGQKYPLIILLNNIDFYVKTVFEYKLFKKVIQRRRKYSRRASATPLIEYFFEYIQKWRFEYI